MPQSCRALHCCCCKLFQSFPLYKSPLSLHTLRSLRFEFSCLVLQLSISPTSQASYSHFGRLQQCIGPDKAQEAQDEGHLETSQQAAESMPETTTRTPCNLRSTSLTCGIRVCLHSVLPIGQLIYKIYRSEEILDSDASDEDDPSDYCSDFDDVAELDDEGGVTLVVIEPDDNRTVQDLEPGSE